LSDLREISHYDADHNDCTTSKFSNLQNSRWWTDLHLCGCYNNMAYNCYRGFSLQPVEDYTFVILFSRTNGHSYAIQCFVCLSVYLSCVTLCIVAKRCVLEQKLLLRAYMKSYMRNRLVPK